MKVVRFILMASVAYLAAGCSSGGEREKEKIYDVKGKVVSVDVEKKSVRLDHEDIPGYMGAMEMPFKVDNAKLLEALKPGDQVDGKLRVISGKSALIELKKR